MRRPRDTTRAKVDRRDFMLGATTALSAAGLAASLGRPNLADGAAPPAGPGGPKPKRPRTEQFTVHQDAPAITPLDVGDPGRNVGDSFYFHANLHRAPGGPVVGEVLGSKTVVKTATPENPGVEQRITNLL